MQMNVTMCGYFECYISYAFNKHNYIIITYTKHAL